MDIPITMIAPCGMNCAACYAHLRKKRTCPGCRGPEDGQPNYCSRCQIRNCALNREIEFCFECSSFPCTLVKRIDKRYRVRYQVSLIENALRIKSVGIKQFLMEEKEKWTCSHCRGVISLHARACSECSQTI
jgi:hypothetical protein